MISASDPKLTDAPRPWYRPSLTTQIMIGLVVGAFIGWLRPDWGNAVYFLRDIFLNLIKSIIAPLVFSTIVVGIAGAGDLRKVGRMGLKAIVYFEIATTAALFIGLAVVNFTKPGVGVALVAGPNEVVNTIAHTHPKTLLETVVHAFPSSVIEAMVRGDVLQIVAFAVLFSMAVSAVGEKGKPIVRAMESLSQVMFKFTNYVMMFAPIGVGAAMAHTVGTQGLGVLAQSRESHSHALPRVDHFRRPGFWTRHLSRPRAASAIHSRRARAGHACLRDHEQRIGTPKGDAGDGAHRRPAAHRRSGHANRLLVQSRWLDALSRGRFRLRRAGGGDDDWSSRRARSADHDHAGADDHFQRASPRCRGHRSSSCSRR